MVYQASASVSASSSANGSRAATSAGTSGVSSAMQAAPSHCGSSAVSAATPPSIGDSHGLRPSAIEAIWPKATRSAVRQGSRSKTPGST